MLDRMHLGARWADMKPREQAIERIGCALQQRLHRTIGLITYPATNLQSMGLPNCGHPKTHTLNPASDSHSQCFDRRFRQVQWLNHLGAPAINHSTTNLRSASEMRGLGGMGTGPQTPLAPFLMREASMSATA